LGGANIFTILSLAIHEHRLSFHFFASWGSISFEPASRGFMYLTHPDALLGEFSEISAGKILLL
jgi:hypothetical protein